MVTKERIQEVHEIASGRVLIAAIGVVIGIIIAPKSGMEVREDMKIKATNTVEAVSAYAEQATQKISNVINGVRGKTDDVKKDIKDKL